MKQSNDEVRGLTLGLMSTPSSDGSRVWLNVPSNWNTSIESIAVSMMNRSPSWLAHTPCGRNTCKTARSFETHFIKSYTVFNILKTNLSLMCYFNQIHQVYWQNVLQRFEVRDPKGVFDCPPPPKKNRSRYIYVSVANGVFTLSNTETDKKWVVYNHVYVFILHRFPLGSILIYHYLTTIKLPWKLLNINCGVNVTVPKIWGDTFNLSIIKAISYNISDATHNDRFVEEGILFKIEQAINNISRQGKGQVIDVVNHKTNN